ncbi:MAG: asparaginase domain-containing protein, partial [Candidatus Fimadaptatus sp.]|nr:asparaginase domain-containing protein [Candidatus Fimadaptatus sp.]
MKVSAHYELGRKTVAILTTGGTIAGSGEIGKETGYVPGALSAEELIASVPQLSESVNIRAVEICSVNSDDITGE